MAGAASLRASRSRRHGKETIRSDIFKNRTITFAVALIFADAILVALIIAYVPYTKIDWDAYMSQVSGFLGGERDYGNLKGDTGPLVYPAGFLYVYSAVQNLTGGQVYSAQTDVVPWWALSLLCLSKRIHSIFVLRLFNDCFAMTLLHASVALFLYRKWHLGMVFFSGAVSIKMNVLLYAPPLLLLLLKAMHIVGVVSALAGAALVQILVGLPFLITYPVSYIANAFDLGRVFIHFWSVNFKFVPERIFVSKEFAVCLLIVHLCLLAVFANYKWCKYEGGIIGFMRSRRFFLTLPLSLSFSDASTSLILTKEHIVTAMFVGNFIGIVCARSLHYQFYSWYFYSLPYLLWRTLFPTWLRLILFVGIELCWNLYPSTPASSGMLLCLHLIILMGLWFAPSDNPYQLKEDNNSQRHKKHM
ncbi:dol-P-Man:Man(5)GlcNAc(2)-PP-Dol alpha-1,3-mannosyltransferase isoform X2 [Capsella rubella]|uniref:dol-P-Man:Man(5)GlcNAc(2)-PP-Dol alpha-1,3-mannosyltransferase isoform X2 n=1 Tax=Capsella rubella TaxID=81985 RepID=UPI000CD4C184|nr:dol-P-Man:Man(5)GlcNAc(2)-PP-Dol alpha-1,3-mannosyltransferase isoform X2 [Capsella rubella]